MDSDTDPPTAGGKPGEAFPVKVIGFSEGSHLVLELESADVQRAREYLSAEKEFVAQFIERGPKSE